MSWEVVFDGNDPVVMHCVFIWNDYVNVSYGCSDVQVAYYVFVCMHSIHEHTCICNTAECFICTM